MNILLDPYMLGLDNEEEIKNNLAFYRTMIRLCSDNVHNICLYQSIYDEMQSGKVEFFPINAIANISDQKLKTEIIMINNSFFHVLSNYIYPIDIDECGGKQNFSVYDDKQKEDSFMYSDPKYYELCTTLLRACYDVNRKLDNIIVTGIKEKGKQVGDTFYLRCECNKKHERQYRFVSINDIETPKEKAFNRLIELVRTNQIVFVECPDTVRGNHHNFLQFDSDFTTFDGVSAKNKRVLRILRYFGLYKIIFKGFHEKANEAVGTIHVKNVTDSADGKIINGYLYAETGYINDICLYFKGDLAQLLVDYLGNDFYVKEVQSLKERLPFR